MNSSDTTLLTVIGLAQDFAILICVAIYLMTTTQIRRENLLLGLILLITFASDIGGFVGGFVFRINMNLLFAFQAIVTLPLWLFFYRGKIKSESIGNAILVFTVAYVFFALLNLFFIQGPVTLNSYTFAVGAATKLVLSLLYFYFLIRELPTESITRLPMFWINTAVLIYSPGTFFVNLATDYLVNVLRDSYINAFTLHNFVGVIFYLLIAVGLWLRRFTDNEIAPIKPTP